MKIAKQKIKYNDIVIELDKEAIINMSKGGRKFCVRCEKGYKNTLTSVIGSTLSIYDYHSPKYYAFKYFSFMYKNNFNTLFNKFDANVDFLPISSRIKNIINTMYVNLEGRLIRLNDIIE